MYIIPLVPVLWYFESRGKGSSTKSVPTVYLDMCDFRPPIGDDPYRRPHDHRDVATVHAFQTDGFHMVRQCNGS